MDHEKYMNIALKEAEKALKSGEIPVGCVFVTNNGDIIATGSNKTNDSRNGTRHAEMVAIDSAILENPKIIESFKSSHLYVTCEPCIMCAAALSKMNINKVVFGCFNDRFGGNGSILSVNNLKRIPNYEVLSGIMQNEAIELFQRFYESENRRAPESKRRRKNR